MSGIAALEQIIGHAFVRPELLEEALTHASASSEGGRTRRLDYERLEFLGDRVLGLVIARLLLDRYQGAEVGVLARRHAALVRREALARVAEAIGLVDHVRLSQAEHDAGGRNNPAIWADCCEAVIGALYLDGGLAAAERFIAEQWAALVAHSDAELKDAKTTLQEWAQSQGYPLPSYVTTEVTGPDHDPSFTVKVSVAGGPEAVASGRSKRSAEQAAARLLLERTPITETRPDG